jgi:hypothetical protein
MYQTLVTKEALMMFKRDRRREIDAVIDYFGESRGVPAFRSRSVPGASIAYVTSSSRFACAIPDEALVFPEG